MTRHPVDYILKAADFAVAAKKFHFSAIEVASISNITGTLFLRLVTFQDQVYDRVIMHIVQNGEDAPVMIVMSKAGADNQLVIVKIWIHSGCWLFEREAGVGEPTYHNPIRTEFEPSKLDDLYNRNVNEQYHILGNEK
jgi:hypothetical protein